MKKFFLLVLLILAGCASIQGQNQPRLALRTCFLSEMLQKLQSRTNFSNDLQEAVSIALGNKAKLPTKPQCKPEPDRDSTQVLITKSQKTLTELKARPDGVALTIDARCELCYAILRTSYCGACQGELEKTLQLCGSQPRDAKNHDGNNARQSYHGELCHLRRESSFTWDL